MANESILIVEDEAEISELIRYNLEKAGYRTSVAMTGEEAVTKAKSSVPDLVLLDLMLPGIDGLEVCRQLKTTPETKNVTVIMLTAKGEESDIIIGLELGADDYMTKPFSPKVLIARIRALMRRASAPEPDEKSVMKVHNIVIHPGRHEVTVDGEPVDLTATEFKVIHCLARRPGWVLTRDQIVVCVHGQGYPVTDRAVDVQIVGVRKKLGTAGALIETVRGIGYRFRE